MKNLLLLVCLFCTASICYAQDDLLDELMEVTEDDEPKTQYTYATFKSLRVINGHSIETLPRNNMLYSIMHRFGPFNTGWRQLWGLDQANIRFGLAYGVTDWFTVGAGRSQMEGTWDFYGKFKVLRQSKGEKKMPISLGALAHIDVVSASDYYGVENERMLFIHRLNYTYEVIIARKFNDWLSLQIMPTIAQQNLVNNVTVTRDNIKYAMGVSGRIKLSQRFALTSEAYFLLNDRVPGESEHTYSFGIDIETGGHVFQLLVTNTRAMTERMMVTSTTNSWNDGPTGGRDVRFGFNIVRNFALPTKGSKKPKKEDVVE